MSSAQQAPELSASVPLLSCNSVSVERSSRALLSEITLHVHPGELVGLIGPNGAGKSTLLDVLAGHSQPNNGRVELAGNALSSIDRQQRARQLGWLEQLGTIHWPLSVERLVTLGRLPHLPTWSRPSAEDLNAVERALIDTDCNSIRQRIVTTLSGGERARVLLARALAADPMLLLADEPVSALDLAHQLQTMDVLRAFAQEQRACLVVLHDLSLAARYCDRLYLLDAGKVISHGQAAEVLSSDNLREVYGVDVVTGWDEVPWIVPVRRVPK